MDQSISLTAPVAAADRIRSIDAIRGVALLGILLMNIPGFGIDWSFWFDVSSGPRAGKDYYTFAVIVNLFEGTMRGLFSMLFGAGMVLFMMNKRETPGQPPVAEYYYRRLLWLVLFGLFNAYILLWDGDILFYYGLCGMLLFPFRNLSGKWLIVIGLLCVSLGMIKKQWNYNELYQQRVEYKEAIKAKNEKKVLTAEQQGAIGEWEAIESRQKVDTAVSNENIRNMRSSYATIFTYFIPRNSGNEVNYMYGDPWDLFCMMFIGMGLFVLGFFQGKLRTSTYLMTLLVGYGIGLPIAWSMFDNFWMNFANIGSYTDRFTSSHMIFAEWRRIPLTIGHASLVMLIFRSGVVNWLMRALANVGQMAFTNYLMQSIICTWFFFGYGFGNYNKLRFYELYYVVFAVWIFQLIFSSIWMRFFRFGPFEWLWRSLTYWKLQPMKK